MRPPQDAEDMYPTSRSREGMCLFNKRRQADCFDGYVDLVDDRKTPRKTSASEYDYRPYVGRSLLIPGG